MSEVNVGTNANDGTGDPLRTAFIKINTELGAIKVDLADVVAGVDAIAQVPDALALAQAVNSAEAAAADTAASVAEAQAVLAATGISAANEFRLATFLHVDDLAAAVRSDTTSQNATRVTASIRACHDAMMAWWNQTGNRIARVIYPAGTLAINDELFSESFAQTLWNMGYAGRDKRIVFVGGPTKFKLKGFVARSAVRTSGRYSADSITYAVPKAVFRWETPDAYANAPNFENIGILGEENFSTDPVGIISHRSNLVTWRNVTVDHLANHGVIIFNMFNSRVYNLEIGECGFQPTAVGGSGFLPDTVTFSNSGATVTASAGVFTSGQVGRSFGLALSGDAQGGVRQIYWANIATFVSSTQVILESAPSVNVSGQRGSFESIRATTVADSAVIEMSATLDSSANLVGRYVTIVGCGQQEITSDNGLLTSVVVAHSGSTITLAKAAKVSGSNFAVCFGAGLNIMGLADATDTSRTDDVTFYDLRVENGGWMPVGGSVSAIISDTSSVDFTGGSKFHGSGSNQNGFGGNFANVIINRSVDLRMRDCTFTHSGHSTRFGKVILTGGKVSAIITGGDVGYPDGNKTAWIYSNMNASPAVGQVQYGLSRIAPLTSSQMNLRLAGSATSAPFFLANSSPVSREGGEELSNLNLRLSGIPTGSGVVSNVTDMTRGKLLTVGHAGNSGDVFPILLSDIDTGGDYHHRWRLTTGATGAPTSESGWYGDTFWAGAFKIQIAYRAAFNAVPRMAFRHNNNSGGGWSEWKFTYTDVVHGWGNTLSNSDIGNFDDITKPSGLYQYTSSTTGVRPAQVLSSYSGQVLHMVQSSTLMAQIAITAGSDTLYYRRYNAGAWTPWRALLDEANYRDLTPILRATEQAASGQTAFDFTGTPAWARRVTVVLNEVSTNGTSFLRLLAGAGAVQTTGYVSTSNATNPSGTYGTSSTTGFVIRSNASASDVTTGTITLVNIAGNAWVQSHVGKSATDICFSGAGSVTLSGALDRIRLTTVNGTNTFDAGSVNILIE